MVGGNSEVRGCPFGPQQQVTVTAVCFCADQARVVHGIPNAKEANTSWNEGQPPKTHAAQKSPVPAKRCSNPVGQGF